MPKPKNSRPNSRAVLERPVTVRSLIAQKILNQFYPRVEHDLYIAFIITRVNGLDAAAAIMESQVAELLATLSAGLEADHARIVHLKESNGVQEAAHYTAPRPFTVEVSTPEAGQYLGLVEALDRLMADLDALWLCGLMDNHHRMVQVHAWERRFVKTANKIRELGNRARGGIRRAPQRHPKSVRKAPAASQEVPTADASEAEIPIDPAVEVPAPVGEPPNPEDLMDPEGDMPAPAEDMPDAIDAAGPVELEPAVDANAA